MAPEELAKLIVQCVPKAFLTTAFGQLPVAFERAPAVIKEHTGLSPFRAARISGHLRFAMTEQYFEQIGANVGAENLYKRALPVQQLAGQPEQLVYQPLQRFGEVVVGYATQAKPGALPSKNRTRHRAAQMNFDFTNHFDLGLPENPTPTLFVCLLTSVDPINPSRVGSMEIAVIDHTFDHFMLSEPVEKFLKRYPDEVAAPPTPEKPLVKLKQPNASKKSADRGEGTAQ